MSIDSYYLLVSSFESFSVSFPSLFISSISSFLSSFISIIVLPIVLFSTILLIVFLSLPNEEGEFEWSDSSPLQSSPIKSTPSPDQSVSDLSLQRTPFLPVHSVARSISVPAVIEKERRNSFGHTNSIILPPPLSTSHSMDISRPRSLSLCTSSPSLEFCLGLPPRPSSCSHLQLERRIARQKRKAAAKAKTAAKPATTPVFCSSTSSISSPSSSSAFSSLNSSPRSINRSNDSNVSLSSFSYEESSSCCVTPIVSPSKKRFSDNPSEQFTFSLAALKKRNAISIAEETDTAVESTEELEEEDVETDATTIETPDKLNSIQILNENIHMRSVSAALSTPSLASTFYTPIKSTSIQPKKLEFDVPSLVLSGIIPDSQSSTIILPSPSPSNIIVREIDTTKFIPIYSFQLVALISTLSSVLLLYFSSLTYSEMADLSIVLPIFAHTLILLAFAAAYAAYHLTSCVNIWWLALWWNLTIVNTFSYLILGGVCLYESLFELWLSGEIIYSDISLLGLAPLSFLGCIALSLFVLQLLCLLSVKVLISSINRNSPSVIVSFSHLNKNGPISWSFKELVRRILARKERRQRFESSGVRRKSRNSCVWNDSTALPNLPSELLLGDAIENSPLVQQIEKIQQQLQNQQDKEELQKQKLFLSPPSALQRTASQDFCSALTIVIDSNSNKEQIMV